MTKFFFFYLKNFFYIKINYITNNITIEIYISLEEIYILNYNYNYNNIINSNIIMQKLIIYQ